MLDRISTPSRLLFAAVSLSTLGAILILVMLLSVMPTASRFDPLARAARAPAIPAGQTHGAGPRIVPDAEPIFDYTFVFPEQPESSAP